MQHEQEAEQGKELTTQVDIICEKIYSSHIEQGLDHNNFNLCKKTAEQGNVDAQRVLADYYSQGKGVEKDDTEAVNWYKKAAEQGDFLAKLRLADCYFYGNGVEQNYSQAVKLYEQVATQVLSGYSTDKLYIYFLMQTQAQVQYQLGNCYHTGNGVKKDPVQAFGWFQKAAEQNNVDAKVMLAECYLEGNGVAKDLAQGTALLEEATEEQKNPSSQLRLAIRFLFGKKVEQNRTRAIELFEKAAELPRGLRWLKPEFDQAHVQAKTILGICHYGDKNYDAALDCFKYASEERNNSVGHLWLACIYQLKNKQRFEGPDIERDKQPWWHPIHSESPNAKYPKQNIYTLLCRAAAGFFLKDDGYDFTDIDIIDFIFSKDEIIKFLENQDFSYAKVILAFYYRCKKEKEKSLELLKKADKENNIIASYELGKYYKEVKSYDEATEYLNAVEQRKNSPFNKQKDYYQEKDINQWLALLAKEELKNIGFIKFQKELDRKNKALESEIKQKESANHRMQRLVEQFTHSLGNIIFPDTIYQVAERLKNNPECRKDVLLLHEAYHSEIIIKLQGELLRQRYANTNPEKFRQFIRSCRRAPNSAENTKSIEDILDYAASRVTARFLNQHYAGLNSIRDKMLSKKNRSLDALKQKFEDDILLNKSLRPIAWINQNLRPIQITEISPLWKKVFILSESHAEALLFGYFSEILFNAFKYADHDKDEFLTLVFDEKNIDDKMYLACSWQNPVKDKSPSMLGTGKGLDAIQEDLKQLNDTAYPEESLLISQQENQFQVTLFFKKDLLVNELPSLKIKRKANVE